MREDELDRGEDKVMFVSSKCVPCARKIKKMYIESCFIVFSFFDMSLAYHEYKFIRKTQRSAVQISCTETIKRLLLTLLRFHFA